MGALSETSKEPFLKASISSKTKCYLIENFSGAGKSTLLNYLSQRRQNLDVKNHDLKLFGNHVDRKTFQQLSAYMRQDDLFIGWQTPREHLDFVVSFQIFVILYQTNGCHWY